jgi:hypothetical protein
MITWRARAHNRATSLSRTHPRQNWQNRNTPEPCRDGLLARSAGLDRCANPAGVRGQRGDRQVRARHPERDRSERRAAVALPC